MRDEGATIIFSTHRMESVEELCDHIALIHKSNKLIEGKLEDVKRQHKTNSFEVGILTDNVEALMFDITQKFTVSPANFKSLNKELKLENIMVAPSSRNARISSLIILAFTGSKPEKGSSKINNLGLCKTQTTN